MDFLKNAAGKLGNSTGGNTNSQNNAGQATGNVPQTSQQQQQTSNSGSGGGFMDKLNGMAGGGAQGEKNEDGLDKGVDWVQEHVMGQGQQSNETAVEQAKDEQISDFIRGQYKGATGKDFFVADKETKY